MKNGFIVNLVCLIFLATLTACTPTKNTDQPQTEVVQVKTAPLTEHVFRKEIRVQGTVQPVDNATISARVAGTIDQLDVEEGSVVKKGDVLFRTDSLNMQNRVEMAQKDLQVAKDTFVTAQMDVNIGETNKEQTRRDFERARDLFSSNTVSKNYYEKAEVAWNNSQANMNKLTAVMRYMEARVEQQKAALSIAEKNLKDSIITAPYDGVITEKHMEMGEFANIGVPVLKMENQNALELSCLISAIHYDAITSQTIAAISLDGKTICRHPVTYCAPSIDPLSRTFEVKVQLPPDTSLISGSLCDVALVLDERKGLGLPTNAVLPRKGGESIVFAAENGKAKQILVTSGFTTDGFTEILNAKDLGADEFVITGQYFLNDGTPISVIEKQ
ncbi:MAG: efflux RND transporter periplasmic adaptor subunit [Candidatus Sumerlaeales bacterium]|nr:efflux RND transporter periplasmic adaptor subunit [Candidatus Sumerlaeales bacterium]